MKTVLNCLCAWHWQALNNGLLVDPHDQNAIADALLKACSGQKPVAGVPEEWAAQHPPLLVAGALPHVPHKDCWVPVEEPAVAEGHTGRRWR